MRGETHSVISNETTALQKLGFENGSDLQRTFSSILNRMRQSTAILPILMELISFLQMISIGFIPTIDGILSGNQHTMFLHTFFGYLLSIANGLVNEYDVNTYLLIIFLVLIALWLIFFLVFAEQYKRKKTFHPIIIKIIYYMGYHAFTILSVFTSSCIGYFLRDILSTDSSISSILSFLSIALFFGEIVILTFMFRIIQSSPDVDIKNKFCFWPQNCIPGTYRLMVKFVLPMILEMLRGQHELTSIFSYIINILVGAGGIATIWYTESNVFPTGKVVLSTEYVILISSSILSIIYHYLKGESLYYLLAFAVIVIAVGILLSFISTRQVKVKIDLLYSKFENLVSNINSPYECISLIKIGIIFNAPCITNHTLLNWAISRWPNHQPLLLMVSFIFYVIHMPYREILDLVSVAVDIAPFSSYDGLLFYQIFNRLPTREQQLLRRLEGVKRLYDLPKTSLRVFWEAVLTHQWDEAVIRSRTFKSDLEHISEIFSNLIFENPSSDCVMMEFIKFASEIQGNYTMAFAAQREMMSRKQMEDDTEPQGDGESIAQMSKLSSVKSSIFLSEFSENQQGFDKVQNGIQSAINARPIYGPNRLFIITSLIALISLVCVVVVYIFTSNQSNRLDNQVTLSAKLHQITLILTQVLCSSLEFSTHDEPPDETISGTAFNEQAMRIQLNTLSNKFDDILASSFSLHSSLPQSFLQLWVDREVESDLLKPAKAGLGQVTIGTASYDIVESNVSLMAAVRLFQLRARTLAFTPDNSIGTLSQPSAEIRQISYLFNGVSEATKILIGSVSESSNSETSGYNLNIYISIGVCLGINLILILIFCPLTILGIMREYDFFVNIFATVPTKTVRQILNLEEVQRKEDDKQEIENTQDIRSKQNKKSLPMKVYHTGHVISMFIGIFIITPITVIIITIFHIQHVKESFFVVNGLYLSSQLVSDFGLLCLGALRLTTAFPSPISSSDEVKGFKEHTTDFIKIYNELFFGGTEFFPTGIINYIDNEESNCNALQGQGIILHNCSSFHDDIYFFYGLCKRLVHFANISGIGGVQSAWWKLFYGVASYSLSSQIEEFFAVFDRIASEQKNTNLLVRTISLVIGIFFFIIALILSYTYTSKYMSSQMKCLLAPIQVMHPDYIADSPFLMRFLQGDFDSSNRQTSRENHRKANDSSTPLIDFILEGVLVMTADGTIIASNKKYHELMVNTVEEVLGLNVRGIFPPSLSTLFDHLDRIKSGGVPQQNVSMETMLFTEDDRELQVRISLVAQLEPNERGNRSTTCAFIISDRSDLIIAQNQLRKEKQNVEELLDSILPHNIAVSLLNGQSEISFEVERACILFSDIVSFTPMCSNMTAKQIMNTLNWLFTEFDTELAQFARVTKLKTIGDAYVCAAGIFEGDGPLGEAAKEIVTFGTHMHESISMINQKHGTAIHMRIGIHTGGPLICGVLGKEKPLFEVIGTTVNIAEDLEASSLHDKIHISQDTYDLVTSLNLKMVERGDNVKVPGIPPDQKTWTIET